ncbi:MAG: trypsin-like serine protease [Hamadaea sp.]|nr:trypsin-like serine protease [Hamadaea sp.]
MVQPPPAGPEPTVIETARPTFLRRHGGLLRTAAIVTVAAVGAAFLATWWTQPETPRTPAARPSASPEPSDQLTTPEIYQTLAPSIVSIRSTGAGRSASTGTGVVANAQGLVLTAYHVVEKATAIEVSFADGTRTTAKVAASDPAIDIAALVPEQLPSLVVPAVLGGGVNIGDDVVAIGNQLGLTGSTTTGVVSGLDRVLTRRGQSDLKGLIQFDAAVNPGSSGGPLINSRGQTVGIVVALVNPTDAGTFIGVGFAVPIGAAVAAGADRPPQV